MIDLPECEQYEGRMRYICRGEVLTRKRCNQYRVLWGLPLLPGSTSSEVPTQESKTDRLQANLTAYSCQHRGEVVRHDTNNLCGARGDDVVIYACVVHGECSLYKYCRGQTVPMCNHCKDRLAETPVVGDQPIA